MNRTTVLVVDDVPTMAEQYAYDLKRVGQYETLVAQSGREALDILEREAVDCVILDLEMPGMDGFEVLRAMERRAFRTPVIVYTGTGNYDRCTQAIRLGARSFIDKAEPMERVVQEVENALERQRLAGQIAALRARTGADASLVGASPAMQQLKDAIARVARIPSPIPMIPKPIAVHPGRRSPRDNTQTPAAIATSPTSTGSHGLSALNGGSATTNANRPIATPARAISVSSGQRDQSRDA